MEQNVFRKIHELQINGWWFGKGRNKIVYNLLRRSVKNFKHCKLLDIGCSEGAFLDFLNSNNLDFCAIDINKEAIELCHKRGYEKKVKYGDIFDIPFNDQTFDVVTVLDVIEHVENDEKALREVFRVLKNGGIVLFIVPAHQWLWSSNDVFYHHKRRYNEKMIKKLLTNVNLNIETLTYFNTFLFPIFVLATYYKKMYHSYKSSNVLKAVPKPINWALSKLMDIENLLISRLGINLPFGSSLIIVARKY